MTTWFDEVQRMDQETLAKLMKLGRGVQTVLQFTGRRKPATGSH